jgi:hypothetical protein
MSRADEECPDGHTAGLPNGTKLWEVLVFVVVISIPMIILLVMMSR